MWVRKDSGRLVNLARCNQVELIPYGSMTKVVACMSDDAVTLCICVTEVEAERVIEVLAGHIAEGDTFADIEVIRQEVSMWEGESNVH